MVSRNPLEMETILLAIASSSNIGSVQTVFGNPQLALIAATTAADHFASSRLDLLRSLLYLGARAELHAEKEAHSFNDSFCFAKHSTSAITPPGPRIRTLT